MSDSVMPQMQKVIRLIRDRESAGEGFLEEDYVRVALVGVATAVAAGVAGYYAVSPRSPALDHPSCCDPDSISSYVYNSYRLNVIKPCVTASGAVEDVF